MAGVSMKDIKLRIRSMESTKQITKAMEMVASSKLRRAQENVTRSRPYFETLYETMVDIASSDSEFSSPFLTEREVKRSCLIVIAGDRGLCGGYNHNVLKLAEAAVEGKEHVCVPIGKKALETLRAHGHTILTDAYAEAADVSISDCFTMAKGLCRDFLSGEIDEVKLCYTSFVSMLNQTPMMLEVLPLKREELQSEGPRMLTVYEPDGESVFNAIMPEFVGGLLYGALCESIASELGARRTAMDAATKNAEEIIDGLSLQYNRARQGAITQEITEIVAGADA